MGEMTAHYNGRGFGRPFSTCLQQLHDYTTEKDWQ